LPKAYGGETRISYLHTKKVMVITAIGAEEMVGFMLHYAAP
jgi:hypothetical protein